MTLTVESVAWPQVRSRSQLRFDVRGVLHDDSKAKALVDRSTHVARLERSDVASGSHAIDTTRAVIAAPYPRRRADSIVAMLYTPIVRPLRQPSPEATGAPSA